MLTTYEKIKLQNDLIKLAAEENDFEWLEKLVTERKKLINEFRKEVNE